MAETMQLIKRVGHADMTTLEKYFGKLKKPYDPVLPERRRKAKNVTLIAKGASNAA
jgi:hypothetical protein